MTLDEIVNKALPLTDSCPLRRQRAQEARILLKARILELIKKTSNFTETLLNAYIQSGGTIEPEQAASD